MFEISLPVQWAIIMYMVNILALSFNEQTHTYNLESFINYVAHWKEM